MRLRNRMLKATFYTDPELCRWPRDKREFYRSLWACAEDSCCLEDDMFGVKLAAWPSPFDSDMTIEQFEKWRDELIDEKKLLPYQVGDIRCLYIPAMARHEKPRNPQSPDVPLPEWVKWIPASDGSKGRYEPDTESLQTQYGVLIASPALSCPVLSCPEQPCITPRCFQEADIEALEAKFAAKYTPKGDEFASFMAELAGRCPSDCSQLHWSSCQDFARDCIHRARSSKGAIKFAKEDGR